MDPALKMEQSRMNVNNCMDLFCEMLPSSSEGSGCTA